MLLFLGLLSNGAGAHNDHHEAPAAFVESASFLRVHWLGRVTCGYVLRAAYRMGSARRAVDTAARHQADRRPVPASPDTCALALVVVLPRQEVVNRCEPFRLFEPYQKLGVRAPWEDVAVEVSLLWRDVLAG